MSSTCHPAHSPFSGLLLEWICPVAARALQALSGDSWAAPDPSSRQRKSPVLFLSSQAPLEAREWLEQMQVGNNLDQQTRFWGWHINL